MDHPLSGRPRVAALVQSEDAIVVDFVRATIRWPICRRFDAARWPTHVDPYTERRGQPAAANRSAVVSHFAKVHQNSTHSHQVLCCAIPSSWDDEMFVTVAVDCEDTL